MAEGIIFDIQRFAVHDGGGIRTNIFFKGCPLHCDWCSNPESQSAHPQPRYKKEKCIGCGSCVKNCPHGAITVTDAYRIDTEKCMRCEALSCARQCYAQALSICGASYTVEDLMKIIRRDRMFYGSSGGGVTVSGGEAVTQTDFLVELLAACKAEGLTTAMETCSACSYDKIRRTLPYIDTYLCDIKHTDPEKLREETGGDAGILLGNIRALAQDGAHIVARVPMIPGFNTELPELRSIGEFAVSCGIREIDLLNFHRLGVPKYEECFIGRKPKDRIPLTEEELDIRLELLRGLGLEAKIG